MDQGGHEGSWCHDELVVPGLMDDEEHVALLADRYASRRAEMV